MSERPQSPFAGIVEKILSPEAKPEAEVTEETPATSPEGEEPEAQGPGQEADPQAEQDDSEPETQEPLHTVVVNGKSEAVPLSELIAGYQRNADYSVKSREVAAERKQVETQKAEVGTLQKNLAAELEAVLHIQKAYMPTPEAMNLALQKGDTASYLQMQQQLNMVQQLAARHRAIQEAQKAESEQRLQATLAEEQKLLIERLPEFKEDKAHQRLMNYLTQVGVPDDEQDKFNRAVYIELAEKARRWDELQTKKPELQKRVESLPKLQKGARQDKGAVAQQDYKRAMANLTETGKFASAQERNAVFGRFL